MIQQNVFIRLIASYSFMLEGLIDKTPFKAMNVHEKELGIFRLAIQVVLRTD